MNVGQTGGSISSRVNFLGDWLLAADQKPQLVRQRPDSATAGDYFASASTRAEVKRVLAVRA
jgi:hypothetical protein